MNARIILAVLGMVLALIAGVAVRTFVDHTVGEATCKMQTVTAPGTYAGGTGDYTNTTCKF